MAQNGDMDITKGEVKELNEKLDRVLSYLDNDPLTGRRGLYEDMQDLKSRVNNIELEKKITKGQKAVFLFIGGIFWSLTLAIWKFFFER